MRALAPKLRHREYAALNLPIPLTVLTGMWGMNIPVPHFFGSPEAQFWWILALMLGFVVAGYMRRTD